MLIDDEEPIAEVLSRALRARGHEVQVATTGADGLISLTESAPDVMLLDIISRV